MSGVHASDAVPPVRFSDAEKINAFQVLIDLYDHALKHAPERSRNGALTELALAAAVVSWWSRWQPITIHAALRSGATLGDIAEATGLDANEVVRRWERWADVQIRLDIGGRPAVDPAEVRAIRDRFRVEVDR
jgi:hypothetical protein